MNQDRCELCLFPKEKHPNSKKGEIHELNCFGPFFGLVCSGDSKFRRATLPQQHFGWWGNVGGGWWRRGALGVPGRIATGTFVLRGGGGGGTATWPRARFG